MDINEVIERLKQLGYTPQNADNPAIVFAICHTESYIKNTCNVSAVPDELIYTAIDMACGEFLGAKLACGSLDGYSVKGDRLIKSTTVGDTSVTYQDGKDSITRLAELITKLQSKDSELISFRKLRW